MALQPCSDESFPDEINTMYTVLSHEIPSFQLAELIIYGAENKIEWCRCRQQGEIIP